MPQSGGCVADLKLHRFYMATNQFSSPAEEQARAILPFAYFAQNTTYFMFHGVCSSFATVLWVFLCASREKPFETHWKIIKTHQET